jgi:hypothetical protein
MKIKDLFKRWREYRNLYKYNNLVIVSSNGDIPSDDLGKTIFLVQREGINRWVVFDCPGGHHKRIEVNLMQSRRPFWNLQIDNRNVTLSPSVWVQDKKCDCHFWLKGSTAYKAHSYHA